MSLKDPAEMTDAELEAAESAVSGEAKDLPADDAETTETTTPSDTQEQSTTATTTEQPADTGETASTTTTPDPKAEAQTSAVAEAGKVAGVASKDGTRVLPYSALQAERRSSRQNAARADRAEKEAERLKQEVEDLRAGKKSPASGTLTEEEVQRMEADYPDEGARMRKVLERNKELEQQIAAAAPKETPDEVSDDPVQEAIDQVPLLLEWQHDAGKQELWQRAIEHDALLLKSPKWKGKPPVERFAEATRRTAEEFDIEVPAPPAAKPKAGAPSSSTAKPSPDPKKVIETAERAAPSTLSDLKGGAVPDHGQVNFEKMAPASMLNRFMDMDPADIDRHLAKLG